MDDDNYLQLQNYVMTTLNELQLESGDNPFDMHQQEKLFKRGRHPSQMDMRDIIDLA